MSTLNRHAFDALLILLSLVCTVLMLIASSDPVPHFIELTYAHDLLKQFPTGNQIVFDLSVGVLAGVFIYYLVVRLPDYQRRRRLRANLSASYSSFREDCVAIYLGCFLLSYPAGLPRKLSNQVAFRTYFKEPHAPGQNRWDAVANGLNDYRLRALLVELEILAHEIHFTLSATDVRDQDAFRFLKRLTHIIQRGKNWSTDYEDVKSMMRFLWSLHTGWRWQDGYPDSDPVADVIAAI